MDRINFLLRDRGVWDNNPNTSYEARDGVRLGVNQYYTPIDISAGENTISPDSTDENNPWDILVLGNQSSPVATQDGAVLFAASDLSVGELVSSVDGNVFTYNSDSGTAAGAQLEFAEQSVVSRLGYYRFPLMQNGFLPELEFPVRADRWIYLTLLGDLQVTGYDMINQAGVTTTRFLNRSLVNLPYPEEAPDTQIRRVVHGHTVQYAQDALNNWYSRRAGTDFLAAGNGGGSNNLFAHLGRADMIFNGNTTQVDNPRFTSVIPLPAYPIIPTGFPAQVSPTDQQGAFFIRDDGVLYFVGSFDSVFGALTVNDNEAPSSTTALFPTSFHNTRALANVDRIRIISHVLAFRSNFNGVFTWTFISRLPATLVQPDGRNVFGLLDDADASGNFEDGTPTTSSVYTGTGAIVDFGGNPTINGQHFVVGYDVLGRFVLTGSQLSALSAQARGPFRGRPPNVIIGNITRQQNVVEIAVDSTFSDAAGDPGAPSRFNLEQRIPNTLLRTEYQDGNQTISRVYFFGNRTLLGEGDTGNGNLTINFNQTTNVPIVDDAFADDFFTEVTLPAGKTPIRMKWSAKAFHILFSDGTLYGAGINSDFHLGTSTASSTPMALRKVQNLPYNVVDWGYYITSHTGGSGELTSGVTMVTRFLLQDDAAGNTNGGLYYICGTLPNTSENNLGIGDPALQTSSTSAGRVIRYPTQVMNSDQGSVVEV